MIKRTIYHSFLFILSKSSVFIAPLFAANILSNSDYGRLEWSLSFSMLLVSIISLASGNTIAFEKIKNDDSLLIGIGKNYSLSLFAIFLFLALFSMVFFNSIILTMVLSISSILIVQDPFSAFVKAAGRGAFATMIDSALYVFLIIILGIAYFTGSQEIQFIYLLSLFGSLMAIMTYKTISKSSKLSLDNLLKLFNRGFPIMVSGVVGILFFSLPKFILGGYSMNLVGEFSLYLRWASIALIGYQFVYVLFFRDLYQMTFIQFEKSVIKIFLAVFFIGILIIPMLYLSPLNDIISIKTPSFNLFLQLFMVISVSSWVISGLLEGILYREVKAKYHVYSNLLGILVFFLCYLSLNKSNNLTELIAIAWTMGFIFVNICQILFIEKYIIKIKKMYRMRLAIGFLLLITFLSYSLLKVNNGIN